MSLDLPNGAQILTTQQISSLQPGQKVFHTEWGEGIFREKHLDADGEEHFIIDNYKQNLPMRELNGDLYLVSDTYAETSQTQSTQAFNHTDERVLTDTDDNDLFLNKIEDDLNTLSGQLNDNGEDVVSINNVRSYQTQTSDLLAKINREITFTESKLKKLNDLRQSLYTHLGKVGHFLNEGDQKLEGGIFKNENVDKAKAFVQKESSRFYTELKDEINDLKNSFRLFGNKRNEP